MKRVRALSPHHPLHVDDVSPLRPVRVDEPPPVAPTATAEPSVERSASSEEGVPRRWDALRR